MKVFSLILLFFSAYTFGMELDNEALQEFIRNQQRMIAVSQGKINNPEHNSFWKKYNELAQLNEAHAREHFEQLKANPETSVFFTSILTHADYQTALQKARDSKTEEEWKNFRFASGALSKKLLIDRNINCDRTEENPTANHFNQNSQLNENQIRILLASSYLLYHNRCLQRKETGKALPEIEITK